MSLVPWSCISRRKAGAIRKRVKLPEQCERNNKVGRTLRDGGWKEVPRLRARICEWTNAETRAEPNPLFGSAYWDPAVSLLMARRNECFFRGRQQPFPLAQLVAVSAS